MNLQDVFDKQIDLNKKINESLYEDIKTNPEERRKWFLNFLLAMQQEQAEAVDSLSWKWWKKMDEDWDNIKVELVDMLHFWVSMCTMADMDAKEVLDLYFKKNDLNHKRQNEGYKDGSYEKEKDGVEDNVIHVLGKKD